MQRAASGLVFVVTTLACAGSGCDAPESRHVPSAARPSAEAQAPIIDGSPDTDHPAVVWLFDADQGAACSGTIIAVDGTTGYVLTAAHCANMDYVAVTTDFRACLRTPVEAACQGFFPIVDQVYHPDWTGEVDTTDFSVLRFVGASATTPVIPAASSSDGVAPLVEIDVVGFGQTELPDNSTRNHKLVRIANVIDEPPLFSHPSTVCFGDSGGPAILDGFVVGVSSFVDDDLCRGYGYSARVETVYADFIQPYITQPPIQLSCDECEQMALTTVGGPCGAAIEACAADAACAEIDRCVAGCAGNAGCESQCGRDTPEAYALHDAIFRCSSCEVCVDACGEDARCSEPSPTASVAVSVAATSVGASGSGGGGGGGTGGAPSSGPDDDADEATGCSLAAAGGRDAGSTAALALAVGWALARRRRARAPRLA